MPGNRVFDVVVFEGPDVLAEFGGVSVLARGNDAVWFLYLVLKSFSYIC